MHAGAVCVALIGTAVLGGEVVVLVATGLLALFSFGMWRKYQRDVLLAKADIPSHRDRLDLLVAGDARASLLAPLVLAVFALVMSPAVPHTPYYVLDAVATVAL